MLGEIASRPDGEPCRSDCRTARDRDVKDRLAAAAGAPGAAEDAAFPASDDAVDSLKFAACLPRALAARTLRERGSDRDAVRACRRDPIRQVVLA